MLLFGRQGRWSGFVLSALLCFGLASPSFAGTVFTWETDDGTISFTDERKRIPAKYRLSATTREMGSLESYPRYTPTGATNLSTSERVASLRGSLAGRVGEGQRTGGNGFDGRAISVGGGRFGAGTRLQVPLGSAPEAEAAPTVVETIRTKPANSLATRTITVVRQGDRIIAVTKAQPNHRSYTGTSATGRDEEDVLR